MNAKLLERVVASVGECTGISCEECRDAILHAAVETCAEIAGSRWHDDDFSQCNSATCNYECQTLKEREQRIRALLN